MPEAHSDRGGWSIVSFRQIRVLLAAVEVVRRKLRYTQCSRSVSCFSLCCANGFSFIAASNPNKSLHASLFSLCVWRLSPLWAGELYRYAEIN
ncbi:MAG: hypothetical protein LH660_02155 [Phormidesmis sp. CAN_BIN36]|nr:hypothetical protein [Phormidesmis sp. CAN_BIN36]